LRKKTFAWNFVEVVVYKFQEREGYGWMHKHILKIELKKIIYGKFSSMCFSASKLHPHHSTTFIHV
jgi:L-ribulose-5-phosphate 3-epimerase UlaE